MLYSGRRFPKILASQSCLNIRSLVEKKKRDHIHEDESTVLQQEVSSYETLKTLLVTRFMLQLQYTWTRKIINHKMQVFRRSHHISFNTNATTYNSNILGSVHPSCSSSHLTSHGLDSTSFVHRETKPNCKRKATTMIYPILMLFSIY